LADAVADASGERASEDADEAPAAEASVDAEDEPADEKPAKAATPKAARPKRADRAASTPRRQRERKERETDPTRPAPVVRAQAKYVRSSARKARLVCDHIRGKSVVEARAILAVTPRAIARDWSKLLESAVANAEHNHELVGEDLVVKAVHADEGPTIKRFRPRAMGRATRIRKRTSHLTILLTPKD
jgi:ribosomal protein L22